MSQLDLWKRSWDPFSPRSLDKFFEDFYTPNMGKQWGKQMEKMAMSPNVEVHESKNMYNMKFDLPGLTKDQIKIDLHDNVLTVSGERKEEKKEDDKDKKPFYQK